MKITIKTLAIGLAVVALMAATSVQASWSSFWVTDVGAGTIDAVTGTISGGGVFAASGALTGEGLNVYAGGYEAVSYPVVWNSPLPGWISANGVNFALMTGPSQTGLLYYWINLSSAITQSFQIDQWYWSGGTAIGHDIITYDGSGTVIAGVDRDWNNDGFSIVSAPVPEPTTMIAGALLLLPFGASTLRMFRKTRTA